jgi:phosphoribosylglycinamide/phosphoribosylaminoimidazolecarboxamide formyltransferase
MRENVTGQRNTLPNSLKNSKHLAIFLTQPDGVYLSKGENGFEDALPYQIVGTSYNPRNWGKWGQTLLRKPNYSYYSGGNYTWKNLSKRKMSTNNRNELGTVELLDIEQDLPLAIIAKHNNPAGIGEAGTLEKAYLNSVAADPYASHGGVIALNRRCDEATAQAIVDSGFRDVVAAYGGFDRRALKILRKAQKTKMGIINVTNRSTFPYRIKYVEGGIVLLPKKDYGRPLDIDKEFVPTLKKPTAEERAICYRLENYVRIVNSNGLVIGNAIVDPDTMEIKESIMYGPGTDIKRSGAAHLAAWRTNDSKMIQDFSAYRQRVKGRKIIPEERTNMKRAYFASDASFFQTDALEELNSTGIMRGGIGACGSVNDRKIFDWFDDHNMFFITGIPRYLKHD